MIRVGIFNTHPIQYQAPVWRHLAGDARLDCQVFFLSRQGSSPAMDPGFGEQFCWDVPLLDGYAHEFLASLPIDEAYRQPLPDLPRFLDRHRFDVVLVHGYTHAYARQLIRAARGRYRVVLRGEFSDLQSSGQPRWRRIARTLYLRNLYRRIAAFSSIGSDSTRHLLRHGVARDRIHLAPYCVDDELIAHQRARSDRAAARAAFGLGPDSVMILFSGKLIPRKQPLMLAEAVERMTLRDRVSVCFLGSGEQAAAVESRLRPTLGSRLIMPGFVNQSALGPYFAAADAFVLPTAHDTWGLVVNEAMHWGLPCVVSDRAGAARDLVVEGVTGFLHGSGDVVQLARHLDTLAANPALAGRMGAAAADRAAGFSSRVTARCLADTFVTVAAR
jgi:glycosyltransferase involved in cell wall biosynthesis